jgi:hypothetical protein
MRNFTLRFVMLFFIAIGFYGCEVADVNPSGCELTEAEAQAYSNVAIKFSNNPTSANCAALRKASLDLIKRFEDCDVTTREYIAELTDFWVDYDCSVFN